MKRGTMGLILGVIILAMAFPAFADLNRFAGDWKNIDPTTQGITTLRIRINVTNVTVHAWGKCHPTDCDWGDVGAYAYAPSVSSNLTDSTEVLTAIFRTNFSEILMIINAGARDRIRTEVLTRFTDNSGRSHYRSSYTFIRARGLVAPQQLSPANGALFNHNPRKTTLRWRPVPRATSYGVEIDCFNCCESGKWCTDVGRTWKIVTGITTTGYTFDFVGVQAGRWRVWAVDAEGQEGPKTDWWQFSYTR